MIPAALLSVIVWIVPCMDSTILVIYARKSNPTRKKRLSKGSPAQAPRMQQESSIELLCMSTKSACIFKNSTIGYIRRSYRVVEISLSVKLDMLL